MHLIIHFEWITGQTLIASAIMILAVFFINSSKSKL